MRCGYCEDKNQERAVILNLVFNGVDKLLTFHVCAYCGDSLQRNQSASCEVGQRTSPSVNILVSINDLELHVTPTIVHDIRHYEKNHFIGRDFRTCSVPRPLTCFGDSDFYVSGSHRTVYGLDSFNEQKWVLRHVITKHWFVQQFLYIATRSLVRSWIRLLAVAMLLD